MNDNILDSGEFYITRVDCGLEFALFNGKGILVKWFVYKLYPFNIYFDYKFEDITLRETYLDTKFLKYVLPHDETTNKYIAETYADHEIMVSLFDSNLTHQHSIFAENIKSLYTIKEGSHN
jgi:hypothetical protein